ncbi:hypothetical protein JRO89_XS02G0286600 [Xanthoceras sorbifolium]|uniref:Protein kinase domain-containing protein n=1 Tax=Xanthoceras sorbifolium TaxID=99658 RepID=A0ABQ8IHK4_9ROSI|nr:hypothetical protein JRO89_XS02G0286600 [Xanthoceras sorbifolium]
MIPNVEEFNVAINYFSGTFRSFITNASRLYNLGMGMNSFSGFIPSTIELEANEFTGSIPATLGNLKQLQGLALKLNKLEGSIPNNLGHFDKLVELYLGNNKLSRAIPPCFELVRAIEGFSESNLLGRGGFGSVFRGKLLDGMEIAVKVFHVQMESALRSFDVECEVLSDVASALEYLHFGYSIPTIHCDVKPSNVLLDQDMVGHLSDFGIAKLLGEEESMTQTLATAGYMAPEYRREGRVSRESDVYSYGIVLMETFTKKKPIDKIFTEEMSLRHWVGGSFNRSIMEVVDNNLLTMEVGHFLMREQCLSSILNLAMDCTRDLPHDRINIRNVVSRLIQIKATFSPGTRGGHVRVR